MDLNDKDFKPRVRTEVGSTEYMEDVFFTFEHQPEMFQDALSYYGIDLSLKLKESLKEIFDVAEALKKGKTKKEYLDDQRLY